VLFILSAKNSNDVSAKLRMTRSLTPYEAVAGVEVHFLMGYVCALAARSKAGSNPARGNDVCLLYLYVVLSCVGRGLCDGLITRPEESYHVSKSV
jgi:hypothetical protein